MKNRFIFRDDTTETCGGPEETYDTTPHTVIRRLSMKSDITGQATSTAQHEGRFVMSTPHIFLSKASEKTQRGHGTCDRETEDVSFRTIIDIVLKRKYALKFKRHTFVVF